eukprot:4394979-Prymnesium_polylepis.1
MGSRGCQGWVTWVSRLGHVDVKVRGRVGVKVGSRGCQGWVAWGVTRGHMVTWESRGSSRAKHESCAQGEGGR